MRKAAQALKEGRSFNMTKFSNNELHLTFPTEMGFPFLYSLKRPTLYKIGGEVRARTTPDSSRGNKWQVPSTVNMTADLHIVYSAQIQGRIGFVTPFDHQSYWAGVRKNLQLNFPIRFNVDIDTENQHVRVKAQPIDCSQNYNLAHYSILPYTAKADFQNPTPLALGKNMQPISTGTPNEHEYSFGEKSTGMVFRLKTSSEEDYQPNMYVWAQNQASPHDTISAFVFPHAQQDIKRSSYDLIFDSERSSAEAVVMTASWNTQRIDNGKSNQGSASGTPQPNNKSPDSNERQEEIEEQAAFGINGADVTSVDFGVEIQGKRNAHLVATTAWASSNTDDQSRWVFYYHTQSAEQKTYEVCLQADTKMPNSPELHFAKALKADPSSEVSFALRFGEQCQSGAKIEFQGQMQQSSEMRDYLRESPMAQQCAKQMKEGNYALPACRNVTVRANQMDQAHFSIEYENVPPAVKNATVSGLRFAQYLAYSNAYENIVDPQEQKDNRIDIDVELSEDFQKLNVSINAPAMDANFTDIDVAEWARPLVIPDPDDSVAERWGNEAMMGQYNRKYKSCFCKINRLL